MLGMVGTKDLFLLLHRLRNWFCQLSFFLGCLNIFFAYFISLSFFFVVVVLKTSIFG